MDIDSLKEKLGDETFAELKAHLDDLGGKLKAVRKKADSETERAAKLSDAQDALLEKLGVASIDDIESLPNAKGQAEAVAQFEAKMKKTERLLAEATAAREEISSKYKGSLQRAALAEAMAGHAFINKAVIESHVRDKLAWEGDDLMFKTDDGHLVSVNDGIAGFAKANPELIKAAGAGGAGVRQHGAGGAGSKQTMSADEFQALTPVQRMEAAKAGVQIA